MEKINDEKKVDTFCIIVILLTLLPPVFSVFFGILSVRISAYLMCSLIALVFLLKNKDLYVRKFSKKTLSILFYYLFWVVILFSNYYSISTIYAKEKTISIIYLIIIPVILIHYSLLSIPNSRSILKKFESKALKISKVSVVFFVIFLLFFRLNDEGRIILPGLSNSIWISRYLGILFLIITMITIKRKFVKSNFLYSLICILLMLFIGSRTPLISLIICLMIISFKYYSFSKNIFVYFTSAFFIYISSVFLTKSYLFETDFYSLIERQDFLDFILSAKFDSFSGAGIGSFGVLFTGKDKILYPHNIFLELFIENGYIGLLLFIVLLYTFFKNFEINIINVLVVYTLINSLSSGDITGNNLIFIFMFVSLYTKLNNI